MNPDIKNPYVRVRKTFLLIIFLVIAAGLTGWWIGRTNSSINSDPPSTTNTTVDNVNNGKPGVKTLVSYTLPDGWKEGACPTAPGSVYISPAGNDRIDCSQNPSSPIKISVDPANNTDCNQLQNVQNVTKHICISEYINGHKSLKSETIYSRDSAYKNPTAINAYYINTGKGVIKVEYVHAPSNSEYQAGLEQLAKSIQVK